MKFFFVLCFGTLLVSCGAVKDYKYYKEGQALNLSRKGLEEIPDYVLKDTSLRVLKLYGNSIDSIPDAIGGLINLEKLYIGKNAIVYISDSIQKLTKLRFFSAQYNDIEQLPDAILHCENLEELILNQNKISSLPDSIGRLKKLQNLQLNFNRLDSLPESIGDCEDLRYLSLNRNFLQRLPESMGKLNRMRDLKLVNAGPLLDVPESFCGLRYLEVLEVDQTVALPPCLLVLQTTRLRILVR
jgi:Leucine-rich repeat (LRR) protein